MEDGTPVLALRIGVHGGSGDDAVVVSVAGELDALTTPMLCAVLTGMPSSRTPHVVLALGGVTFLDPRGLGHLQAAQKELRDRGGELVLSSPPECVLRLLEWTGTDRCFMVEQLPPGPRVGDDHLLGDAARSVPQLSGGMPGASRPRPVPGGSCEAVRPPARPVLLTTGEIAVLCMLQDCGTTMAARLAEEVPGALDLVFGLRDRGYVESSSGAAHEHPGEVGWSLTDKGVDMVVGEA